MNEVMDALVNRRSVRKYKAEAVPEELVKEIVEAGLYAPSGMGYQKPVILAVTDKETRDELSDLNRKAGGWKEGFDPFYGAPVVISVLTPKDWDKGVEDGSLAIGQMLLAAHALGLGGCWIHRAKEVFETEALPSDRCFLPLMRWDLADAGSTARRKSSRRKKERKS